MGSWMNKLEKLSVSAVTRMKTYIKKKEIEEEPDVECYDDWTINEGEDVNMPSTDASKENSDASPPKDEDKEVKKEIEVGDIIESSAINYEKEETQDEEEKDEINKENSTKNDELQLEIIQKNDKIKEKDETEDSKEENTDQIDEEEKAEIKTEA